MAPKDQQSSPSEATPLVKARGGRTDSGSSSGIDAPLSPPLAPLVKAPVWQFWRTTSPAHRFFLLVLMSCIPFGGHFVKVSSGAVASPAIFRCFI